jgi:hypothetical protein
MMPLRTILVLAAATGVALLAIGAGVASAHTVRFDSSTTFRFTDREGEGPTDPDLEDDFFAGRITSLKPACERGRIVRVFREVVGAPDDLVTATSSEADGSWSVLHEDPGAGTYYAKVLRKDISRAGHDHVCRPAVSQDRFVNDQP